MPAWTQPRVAPPTLLPAAAGAIVIALMAPRFNPLGLMINLAAIALGLLMGKGLGRLIYRRGLPAADK